jgi:hypothetical protein
MWLDYLPKNEAALKEHHQKQSLAPNRYLIHVTHNHIHDAASRRAAAETFDSHLGHVFYSSGLYNTYTCTHIRPEGGQCYSTCRLDYGAVELAASRSAEPFPNINLGFLRKVDTEARSEWYDWFSLDVVFAKGRSTGVTRGQPVGSSVVARTYSPGGRLASETFERAVLPCANNPVPGYSPTPPPVPFAHSGDSGALVFNVDGPVGLLWGAIECKQPVLTNTTSTTGPPPGPSRWQSRTWPPTLKTWSSTHPSTLLFRPSRTS